MGYVVGMRRVQDVDQAPKFIDKVCKKHGLTSFALEGSGYYRCRSCRSERAIEIRRGIKQALVDEHGGCCAICGYDRCIGAFHFHHPDPTLKECEVSNQWSLRAAKREASKCVMVCSNCHTELELGVVSL